MHRILAFLTLSGVLLAQHEVGDFADRGDSGSVQRVTPDFGQLEDRIRIVSKRAVQATVFIWNGAGGSGVLISEDGWILTAAHVLKRPQGKLQVQLHDGRIVPAKIMGRLPQHDAAIIKLTRPGSWPFCPLAPAGSLQRGALCLATGVPLGIRRDRPAPLRLGTVLDVADDFLRTSCTLDQGDSGGPLFDLDGRVVGINSRIGYLLTMNYHISVDLFHEKWETLTKGEVAKGTVGENAPRFHRSALRNAGQPWRLSDPVQRHAAELVRPAMKSVVEIEAAGKRRALGIIIREDGWVLTKASLTGGKIRCRIQGGERLAVLEVRKDPATDLALLRVEAQGLEPLSLTPSAHFDQGRVLLSPNPRAPTRLGIVSAPLRKVARIRTRLGVLLGKDVKGGARITKVTTGSSAHRAGIKVGDVVVSWDQVTIAVPDDLRRELRKIDPGTRVVVGLRRGGKLRQLKMTIGSTRDIIAHKKGVPVRPEALRGLRLSRRRSGFPRAFQHDTVLAPRDCGGPILDRGGRCIGVNVARASRHSSYAIPAREVEKVVQRLLKGR